MPYALAGGAAYQQIFNTPYAHLLLQTLSVVAAASLMQSLRSHQQQLLQQLHAHQHPAPQVEQVGQPASWSDDYSFTRYA